MILNDLKSSEISVDNITKLGIIPPKLSQLFNKLGYFYYWFVIPSKSKIGDFHNKLKSKLSESCCVDLLQRQILMRKKYLPLIMIWCEEVPEKENVNIDN